MARLVQDKETETGKLQEQIDTLQVSVSEREMIFNIQNANRDTAADAHKRVRDIYMKRKLQNLVGMQTQEIELLREELDRLRRRTFPTFTHTDTGRGADRPM